MFAEPENKQILKILEASEISLKRLSLNKQVESKKLLLFRNGVTRELFKQFFYQTFNNNCLYVEVLTIILIFAYINHFYYSTEDALLPRAFTNILNCCDIHFTYI